MASKRPPIEVAEISQNLRDSRGQEMNAFFSQTPPEPATPVAVEKKAPAPRNHGTGYQGTAVLRYRP
jgi:hypothetical protein